MFRNFYHDGHFSEIIDKFNSVIGNELSRTMNSCVEPVETGWRIELALPGFTKKEIEIKVDSGILKIKGTVSEEETSKIKKPFNYEYNIPRSIKVKKIDAKIESGILVVNIIKESVEENIDIKFS